MKVTHNFVENHELIALQFYFLLQNINVVKSPFIIDLLEKVKNQSMSHFVKTWLKVNPDIRISIKRLQPSLDGTLNTNFVTTVIPDGERVKDKSKQSILKRAVTKLMNNEDLSMVEFKLIREHHDLSNESVYKPQKTYMKYLIRKT